jgi:ketosteroid isomerase-like protein
MNEVSLVLKYFTAFSEKRIDVLEEMFTDDAELIDWDNHAQGKEAVLLANIAIFDAVKNIEIYIDQIGDGSDTVFAEIKVIVDGTTLNVVDVITFENNKIKKIRAYKR